MENLRSKVIKGGIWVAIQSIGSQLLRLIITIFLARLLSPSEFGLIGMLSIFFAIANSLVHGGFVWALIQKNEVKEIDYHSVFWINFFFSLLIYIILFLIAPFVSDFYSEPKLVLLLRIMALSIILNSTTLIQTAFYSRNINYKKPTKIRLISSLVSGIFGIFLAFYGFGVWALVSQILLNGVLSTIFFWIRSEISFKFQFSIKSIKSMIGYGGIMLVGNIIGQIGKNIFSVFIGKYYSPLELGYYTQSEKFKQIPTGSLDNIIRKITFPLFSRINKDVEKSNIYFHKSLNISFSIIAPILVGMGITAENWVPIIIGEKWLDMIPIINLLAIDGLFFPLIMINSNLIASFGKAKNVVIVILITNILLIATPFFTYKYGIIVMIYFKIIVSIVSYYISSLFSSKILKTSFFTQIRKISKIIITLIVMAVVLNILSLFELNNIVMLILKIVISIGIYFSSALYFRFDIVNIYLSNRK